MHCKVEQKVERDYLRKIGFPAADIETAQFWRGAGCENAASLATRDARAFMSCLILNEALRPLILTAPPLFRPSPKKPPKAECARCAPTGGNKVKTGKTTIEEVLRVTQIEEHMDALSDDSKTLV